MNISVGRLPWFGQVAVCTLLAGVGVGAFWQYYAAPADALIAAKRDQLVKSRAELDRGLAITRQLPEFRSEVEKLEVQLSELRMVLPEEKDVADLLRRIQVMATESDLTIRGFTPRAVVSRQVYVEWPIGLQLEGTYHNLGRFLERISKFPRIINVTGLNVKAMENPTRSGTVLAECTAMTFVMTEPKADDKDPKAPASPGAAKPAGARAE